MNPKSDALLDFMQDQLASVPEVRFHRMFGGYGIYSDDVFFGIIHGESLYFHTSPETQKRYEKAGTSCFITPGKKIVLKRYFEVPPEISETKTELLIWAQEAVESAHKKPAGKKKGK